MSRFQIMSVSVVLLWVVWAPWAWTHSPADADNSATPDQPTISQLQAQVEQLSEQLGLVQEQLEQLISQQENASAQTAKERLQRAAQAQLAEQPATELDTDQSFESGTRMQAQLNPEISVTGDLWLVGGDKVREELQAGHFELDMRSYLDPFSFMHLVVGFADHADDEHGEDEEEEHHDHHPVEIEEGYITWLQLPGNLSLTLGKKRQQYGVLNRWHAHALDQADMPWVLESSFGDHGLTGTGLSVEWLMPRLWADANELTVEITNGDNELAFAGGDWNDPTVLARLKSYWDLSTDSYLEIGLNGVLGASDPDGQYAQDFYALDFGFNWNPAGRELYKDVTIRGLIQRSERDNVDGSTLGTWGGFIYGQTKLSRSFIAGIRYDRVEDPFEQGQRLWGISPYLTFWQSEFVRLRLQASYRDDSLHGVDRQYLFQTTFSAGPHKHETY